MKEEFTKYEKALYWASVNAWEEQEEELLNKIDDED